MEYTKNPSVCFVQLGVALLSFVVVKEPEAYEKKVLRLNFASPLSRQTINFKEYKHEGLELRHSNFSCSIESCHELNVQFQVEHGPLLFGGAVEGAARQEGRCRRHIQVSGRALQGTFIPPCNEVSKLYMKLIEI